MVMLRRVLLASALGAATLGTAPATASAIGERVPQPILLSDPTLSWVEGHDRWVTLSWTAQDDIDGVAITVLGTDDVTIGYEHPEIGHAELAGGPDLSANEIDATTFFLDPGTAAGQDFELELLVDWNHRGVAHSGTIALHVHQEPAGNAPFLVLTNGARVPASGDGARNWVTLGFIGLRRGIGNFSVSVEGDLPIYYPQTSFTSLHHDAMLLEDERDVARFWIDPSTIQPGDYLLEVVVSYTIDGGATQTVTSPLRVLVD